MPGLRVAILSTYPPRVCGLASFACDLRSELVAVPSVESVPVVAVVRDPAGHRRPETALTIRQDVSGDYLQAARLLGGRAVDAVLMQHEYGIYGGVDGDHVLAFARELEQPLVVTLHTILSEPSLHQIDVLAELCARAALVIVMTDTAARLLDELDACDPRKVRVVPHGAPAVLARVALREARRRSRPSRPERDREKPFQLATFGLISPGKGLETAIDALSLVLRQHPEVRYVISGRTHPDVAASDGERYRLELERRIAALGLADHVVLEDRFRSLDELAELLAVTDVFLTPYRNREQIASGTLTFAIAAGCAAVSTPYWYAQDVLSSGAGRLVPFDDPAALAQAVCALIEDPRALAAARAEARRIGGALTWPAVAGATAEVMAEAIAIAQERGSDAVDPPAPGAPLGGKGFLLEEPEYSGGLLGPFVG